jgi:SAM-dependent methyltransferase
VDFFSSWENYRAVIESNAMEHNEIYAAVHGILLARTEPFSLIDLGCGDAAGTAPALAGTRVTRYVGVDVAAPALDLARANLQALPIDVDLRTSDLSEAMTGSDETYDVALACFVVHHLAPDDKRSLFAAVRERLNYGGELILVDLVREDGTARNDFLELQDARIRTWPIGAALQERTVDHANGFDFPEERSTQPRWARDAGYREVIEFYGGGDGTQAGWRMLR